MTLQPGLGNWVSGDRFFNRDKELKRFTKHLLRGESMLLVAQRRVGKTSLMREASARLEKEAIALHLDLEKAESAEDALVEMASAIRKQSGVWAKTKGLLSSFLKDTLEGVESLQIYEFTLTLRGQIDRDSWREKGDALFDELAKIADAQGRPVLVFMDEVPILVSRMLRSAGGPPTAETKNDVDLFMSWLRQNAMKHKGRVAVIVTGSIGLGPLLNQAGLNGTLNAYRPFELNPWDTKTAVACLLALAKTEDLDLSAESAALMISLLGSAVPHHVQMFFDKVLSAHEELEEPKPVSEALIRSVYKKDMATSRGHAELSHMEERLRLLITDTQYNIAFHFLTHLSLLGHLTVAASKRYVQDEFGASAATLRQFSDVLDTLRHDGYVEERNGGFVFVSHLLRDWWADRFGHAVEG